VFSAKKVDQWGERKNLLKQATQMGAKNAEEKMKWSKQKPSSQNLFMTHGFIVKELTYE
jgi:hypothetical protein